MTWTCHICGDERPDEAIAVISKDRSFDHRLPAGTVIENVRFCKDRRECIEGSEVFSFFKSKEVRHADPQRVE